MNTAEEKLLQQLQSLKDPCPPLEALAELVEGDILLEDREELESHIHACLPCLNRLNDLWETLYLAEKGETPPPAFVAEARRFLFPPEEQRPVRVVSFGAKLMAAVEAAGDTLRDWMTPRFLGELAAAAAVAGFLVVFGNSLLRQGLVPNLTPGTTTRGKPVLEPAPPAPGGATRGGAVEEPPPPELAGDVRRTAFQLSVQGAVAKQKGNLKEAREFWEAARDLYAKAAMKPEQAEVQQWLDELDK